jgi:hypothetical protein
MKIRSHLFFIFVLVVSRITFTQSDDHDQHHHHEGSNYEIGLSPGIAYLAHEEEYAPNVHIHLMRRLGSHDYWNRWAVGLGVESIIIEHMHYSFLATFSYNIIGSFIIDLSPGLLLTEHDGVQESQFITHIEMTYEMDFHGIGIGPVMGMAVSQEDEHYMLGIHIGKGL